MNRTQIISRLLEVLNDSEVRGIWDQNTLIDYLAEGQDKFCEDTGYFKDISSFTITMQTGVALYSLPDRIIQIIDIWDGTRKLGKIPTGEEYLATGATGAPAYWDTDVETGVVKLFPTPTADQDEKELVLQVWRYSVYDFADDGKDPEIPARFQQSMVEWAAYRAFSHHDMEEQDPVKATDHLRMYREYVRQGKRALKRYQNQEVFVGCDPAYNT